MLKKYESVIIKGTTHAHQNDSICIHGIEIDILVGSKMRGTLYPRRNLHKYLQLNTWLWLRFLDKSKFNNSSKGIKHVEDRIEELKEVVEYKHQLKK